MIGKYVGGGRKNIAEICRNCQDAISDITTEKIRINIEPDKKMNMKSSQIMDEKKLNGMQEIG